MVYPELPKLAQEEYDDSARRFLLCIHTQDYVTAEGIVKELLDKMLSWQERDKQRYHKGFPIHNIGYALSPQNKPQEALKYFMLAYIEDLLSAEDEGEADETPAGRTLLSGYKLAPEFLEPLKRTVRDLKSEKNIPSIPEEVVQRLEKSGPTSVEVSGKITVIPRDKGITDFLSHKASPPKQYPRRQFLVFKSAWEKRVFVGGSGDPKIRRIQDIVNSIDDYDAVVAIDFSRPGEMSIYRKCLALLHSCKYAIFDLKVQGGQLIEIERAPDYGVKTLAIWPKNKEGDITEVLKSCLKERGIEYNSYADDEDDLDSIVRNFLK